MCTPILLPKGKRLSAPSPDPPPTRGTRSVKAAVEPPPDLRTGTVIGTQTSVCHCSKWIMCLWKSQAQSYFKNNEFARTYHEPSNEILNLISCFVGISEKVQHIFLSLLLPFLGMSLLQFKP